MPTSYFESVYCSDPDPWGFETSRYEQRKYDITVAVLPQDRYRRGLEPGCANGVLTERLAERCDELFAFDHMAEPISRARRRMADHDHVHVLEAVFPTYLPAGRGDLVVWSEVAYYLDERDAQRALQALERWLEPGGTLVAVHYTGETNYPRTARQVHDSLDDVAWLERHCTHDDAGFSLGVWRRRP
ncbi:SAM-dependent methyltransferase [Ilumatobacter sp.]|uniref:SAM-dependent methyltransferase n=1 Tax=Ilumatobacter sp. TaxID=1967498 RepID=UPI003B51BC87